MFFEDLSPYRYGGFSWRSLLWRELNVGWLDGAYPFAQGNVPHGFLDRLFEFYRRPVRRMRGFHTCQFCSPAPEAGLLQSRLTTEKVDHPGSARILRACLINQDFRVFYDSAFGALHAGSVRSQGFATTLAPEGPTRIYRHGRAIGFGSGEIRVRGRGRIRYAAPTLIYHYIETHRYLPPQEFIEAVLAIAPKRDE
ncbi:MAG: hypothetical protein AB1631_00845 [Acidobacteriota bacterium]